MKNMHDVRIVSKNDGASLAAYRLDAQSPRAVVLMVHGLAEHGERYDEFATFLAEHEISSLVYDHRGHGKSRETGPGIGAFAESDGWNLVLHDLLSVSDYVQSEFPDIPVFLLGHSMGSFAVRTHISRVKNRYSGVVLSGTATDPGVAGRAGLMLSRIMCLAGKSLKPSPLLNSLTFGAFNKAFRPAETDFDWLSNDREERTKYVEDPMCGFIPVTALFSDMIAGLIEANSRTVIAETDSAIPLLFISGGADPVGGFGKGCKKVIKSYEKRGHSGISVRLYPDGRHEMLHELNRKEVFKDILEWINPILHTKTEA